MTILSLLSDISELAQAVSHSVPGTLLSVIGGMKQDLAADGAIHALPERTGPSALWYLGNVDGPQRKAYRLNSSWRLARTLGRGTMPETGRMIQRSELPS